VFDSMNACWCEHVGMPIFAASCMTEEERQREACVHNPWGPDDGPRSECLGFLRASSGIDQSALLGGMCHHIQPNCDHRGFIDVNSTCGCWNPSVDPNPALGCPNANVINCGPDSVFDQRSCGCQPLGSGENPWGGDPLCGNDPQFSPGGRDAFITRRADDLLTSRFVNLGGKPTVDLHMVRAGGFVPVVGPALFTRAFDKLGTQLQLDIKMPAAVGPSGYRGAVSASCTSQNVTNHLIGERQLQDLALGGMHTLAFSLSPEDLELCAGSDSAWRVEFGVDSDPRTVQRLGVGAVRFAGTPVPVDEPLPLCPTAPISGVPFANPPPPPAPVSALPNIFGDGIANPTSWTFSNGDVTQVR
jgi:hypothetical protein